MDLYHAKNLQYGIGLHHKDYTNKNGDYTSIKVTSVKTWKRQPERVEIHVRIGYRDFGTFTESDLPDLHYNYPDHSKQLYDRDGNVISPIAYPFWFESDYWWYFDPLNLA